MTRKADVAMQKVLVYRWKSYTQVDLEEALKEYGFEVVYTDFECISMDEDPAFEQKLTAILKSEHFACVFSANYFTVLSAVCERAGIPYVSWLCDSRVLALYNQSLHNKCNYIFAFDLVDYYEFKAMGANIFYLPLAAAPRRLEDAIKVPTDTPYGHDISFVGSLYAGKNQYDKSYDKLSPYLQGYFDAALAAQCDVYGEDVLGNLMSPEVIDRLGRCLNLKQAYSATANLGLVFEITHLNFKMANLERTRLLSMLAPRFDTHLYSDDPAGSIPCLHPEGMADYWTEMPHIFADSKINLNITMRNIRSGLPQRFFDILGCGGFLLSNFQAEISRHFTPGKDMVLYNSMEEAVKLCDYYLNHEDERSTIAAAGLATVKAHHTYAKRMEEIFSIVPLACD